MRKRSRYAATCPNEQCELHGRRDQGNIAPHGFSRVKWGRRRRYRCTACGKTFGATTGTPYKRLQYSMRRFDRVVALSVEGVSKSAIARLEGISWSTVARWLERAAESAHRFNRASTRGGVLRELQLDEMRSFVGSKNRVSWVFTAIEVCSRMWQRPSSVRETTATRDRLSQRSRTEAMSWNCF